ncbi:MAG: hypothetical protein COA85_08425 [Robiginitomaculum sp.]|nr:MAG: hypothetical protein COA85_08425 [Robiginitomaculum sp.]
MLTIHLLTVLDVDSLSNKLKNFVMNPDFLYGLKPSYLSMENLDLWAKNRLWKRYEAALLSLGFIIDADNNEDFENLLLENLKPTREKVSYEYFPLFRVFQERDKLLTNSDLFADNYDFHAQHKAPAISIINWFEKMEIDLPNSLADRVKYFQSQPSVVESESPETLSKKERTSLLTLIYAMGKKPPFSYDPDDSRNGAISRIQSAITEAGLRMSNKTIRKYLREANSEAENIRDKSQ